MEKLGAGDTGLVELVRLVGTDHQFALKSLDKREMLERNKVGGSEGLWWVGGQA